MMTKKKTPHIRGVKFVWALPALALLLFAFAEPEYRYKETNAAVKESTANMPDKGEPFTIHGKVIMNDTKEPIPGASIVIKGTSTGTVSDIDGTFTLVDSNPTIESDGILRTDIVVSFVGMQTVNIILTANDIGIDKNKFIITMEDAVQVLYNKSYSGEQLLPPPPPPPPAKKAEGKKEVAPPPPPPPADGEKEVFYIVEDMPKYPGGFEVMQDYIAKMQQKIAQGKGVKGKAKVAFTINGKGKVSDIKVVEQDNDSAAKGAYAIANSMPEWTPGKQRGKAVPVKYLLPVEFK